MTKQKQIKTHCVVALMVLGSGIYSLCILQDSWMFFILCVAVAMFNFYCAYDIDKLPEA